MRRLIHSFAIALAFAVSSPAFPQPATPSKDKDDKEKIELPADVAGQDDLVQSVAIDGRIIRYNATVGHIDVRDEKGKTIGQVVFTAYTIASNVARPVTFAFCGGPGAHRRSF